MEISPDDIGLVWMDIEGAEPAALKSMRNLVERRRIPLLMEYVPSRYAPSEAAETAAYLAQYFRRCIVFSGKSERDADIRDLPGGTNDILLLP